MIRFVRRIAIAIAVASAVLALTAYLVVRESLPQLDGDLVVNDLGASVQIDRDARGITTITAASRTDLAFGTGFAHAQDRFFQMDLLRRQAAGELSALIGPLSLPLDRQHRQHRLRSRSTTIINRLPGERRRVLEAYASGVNAGLTSLGSRPFEYWLLGRQPEAWIAEDSVLVLFSMFLELNDETANRDVARGFAKLALPPDYYQWLYPDGSDWDAALDGSILPAPGVPGPDIMDLRAYTVADGNPASVVEDFPGSNSWAVSGALTATGRAIVANDTHLKLQVPNIWYRARLVQTSGELRDLVGLTLPGAPFLTIGSNGQVAWSFTNSYGDWSDAVILRPGTAPGSYMTADGERQLSVHREQIEVAGGDAVELLVTESIWGPVRTAPDYPDGPLAISWTAHHAEAANVELMELETVRSVDEALHVANRLGIPPQNFVVGDANGNIAWTIAGQIPRRGAAAQNEPADWSRGDGWQGWLAPDEFPRIVNPPGNRIWTANSRVVGGAALRLLGNSGYDPGARAKQIRDGLRSADAWTETDMLDVHLDDRAVFLGRWQALLLALLDDDALAGKPLRQEFLQLVEGWEGRAATDSAAYRLVRAFRIVARRRVFDMLTTPVIAAHGADVPRRIGNRFEQTLWQLVSGRPPHMLTRDYPSWRSLLLQSIDECIDRLTEGGSLLLAERSWGERNTASIRHPLSAAVPFLSRWLDMPADPLPGDSNMPRVQSPSFGASERFAVSPGAESGGYLHMPGGQSGHPLSEFYGLGHEAWVQGLPDPFMPGDVQHALRLLPVH